MNPRQHPLEIARYLCDVLGFSVCAAPIGSKVPWPWKVMQERQPSDAELVRWFGPGRCNVGIVTGVLSGICVLDTDDAEAEAWVAGHFPETPMMVKTRKGYHRYYRHPGGTVRNRSKMLTPGGKINADWRCDGGYVLGPGAIRSDGSRYQRLGDWTKAGLKSLPEVDPAWFASPERAVTAGKLYWKKDEGSATPAVKRARSWMAKRDAAVQGNGGDHHTYATACFLVWNFGLSAGDAMQLLLEWNGRCVPPWREEELLQKVLNSVRYGVGAGT